MIYALFASIPIVHAHIRQTETDMSRIFTKGQKLTYQFRSTLNLESRERGLLTWIPQDLDINYNFSFHVTDMKGDGIAVVRYSRPTMTEIEGETVSSPPVTKVDKVNLDYQLSVSPANEIIDQKDLSPKKPIKKDGGNYSLVKTALTAPQLKGFVAQFVSEIYRLSLFVGGIDSGLDFAPKMPTDTVKLGETWKRTVGFTPQKLRGKDGKMAVQRIDYTYTYRGVVDSNGKKVLRVDAKTEINSDLAQYVLQVFDMKPEDTDLKKALLTMKAGIEFDLDVKTRDTIEARATSEAGFSVYLTKFEDPIEEIKMKGHSTMSLVKREVVPEIKKKG